MAGYSEVAPRDEVGHIYFLKIRCNDLSGPLFREHLSIVLAQKNHIKADIFFKTCQT